MDAWEWCALAPSCIPVGHQHPKCGRQHPCVNATTVSTFEIGEGSLVLLSIAHRTALLCPFLLCLPLSNTRMINCRKYGIDVEVVQCPYYMYVNLMINDQSHGVKCCWSFLCVILMCTSVTVMVFIWQVDVLLFFPSYSLQCSISSSLFHFLPLCLCSLPVFFPS